MGLGQNCRSSNTFNHRIAAIQHTLSQKDVSDLKQFEMVAMNC